MVEVPEISTYLLYLGSFILVTGAINSMLPEVPENFKMTPKWSEIWTRFVQENRFR